MCVRRVCAHLSCCVGWRISCWRVIGACERRPGVISVYSVIRISNRIQVGSASGKTRRAGAPKNIARGKWRIILNRQRSRVCSCGSHQSACLVGGVSSCRKAAVHSSGTKAERALHTCTRPVAQRTPPPGDACGSAAVTLTAARVRRVCCPLNYKIAY